MAPRKNVEAYIPAGIFAMIEKDAIPANKALYSIQGLTFAEVDTAVQVEPFANIDDLPKVEFPATVEGTINMPEIKTWARIAVEPCVAPPATNRDSANGSKRRISSHSLGSIEGVYPSSNDAGTAGWSSTPASSLDDIEVAPTQVEPSIWSERQAQFGTRAASGIMTKGIPFARNHEDSKVLNVVEDSQILFDNEWKKVRVGQRGPRHGTRFMLVNSARKAQRMVETLVEYSRGGFVSIFMDLEGEDLGARNGTTDILAIYHLPTDFSFLVPLTNLGGTVFDIKHSTSSWTLRDILEHHTILKGIWDVRNDSAGLFRNHNVYLGGMFDIQLAFCKVDNKNPSRLGLAAAIEKCCGMSGSEIACVRATKTLGKAMWCPDQGGSFEVFRADVLDYLIKAYSIGDVALLAELLEELTKSLTWEDWRKIRGRTTSACERSWKDTYDSGFSFSKVRNPYYTKGAQRAEQLRQEREALAASETARE